MDKYYEKVLVPDLCVGIYRDEGSVAPKDTLILLTSEAEVYWILDKLNQED